MAHKTCLAAWALIGILGFPPQSTIRRTTVKDISYVAGFTPDGKEGCLVMAGETTAPSFPRMNEGVFYTMKRLAARAMFPSHLRGREEMCGEFARDASAAGIATPTYCPEFGGDRFAVARRAARPAR